MLMSKNIAITDIELRMLIEAAVNEFNKKCNAGSTDEKEED